MSADPPDRSRRTSPRGLAKNLEKALGAAHVPLETPPPLVSQRLQRIPTRLGSGARAAQQLVTETIVDGRTDVAGSGTRGVGTADLLRYQVLVRAHAAVSSPGEAEHDAAEHDAGEDDAAVDVVLDIEPEGTDAVHVRGQVLTRPPMPPVFEATAHGPYGSLTTILGDELGNFDLAGVPRTTQRLVLTNDVVTIELPAGAWLDER